MKNNLPFFSHDHDAHRNRKHEALIAEYGWEGYGRFWALNELISEADECRLDLGRPLMRSHVALELGLSVDAFEAFLAFLADPERCGLVRLEGGVLTTERTQEDLAKVQELRRKHKGIASGQHRNSQGRFHRSNGDPSDRDGDRTVILRTEKEPDLLLSERENIAQNTVIADQGIRSNGEASDVNGRASTVERLDKNKYKRAVVDNSVDKGDGAGSPSERASAPSKKQSREERIAAQKKVLDEQARQLLGGKSEKENGDEDPF